MDEIWKPVPEFEELYEVSNLGRVKSLGRIRKRTGSYKIPKTTDHWTYKPRILKPILMNNCVKVNLHSNGSEQYQFIISHLVARVFLLPENINRFQVSYKDNDYTNCKVDNLVIHYNI